MRVSDTTDPYWNLAIEEWLLDRAADAEPILYLWQSTPAVIIGKNQNPWRECNLRWMKERCVRLARRVSGGGAVYHDEGNLNYAFFMPRTAYRADAVFALIGDVLADFGFATERMKRTSLVVDGLKVSGNAFCFRRNAALHHGTLLVDSDLAALDHALRPSAWTFETRAKESVRARVRNLSTAANPLTVQQVREAFIARGAAGDVEGPSPDELAQRIARLQSDEWLFQKTPPFRARLQGENEHFIEVEGERGMIKGVKCRVGTMQESLNRRWCGRLFDPDALSAPFDA